MSEAPLRRSALDDRVLAPLDGAALGERSIAAFVSVAAWPDTVEALSDRLRDAGLPALPSPGRSTAADGVTSLDAGPGAAYVTGSDPEIAGRLADLVPADIGTVTDLSHARICLRLSGPRAAWVLSKGIALDLREDAFPPGRCATMQFHHVGVLLHRLDALSWDLYAYRGLAVSLAHALEVAGAPDRVAG